MSPAFNRLHPGLKLLGLLLLSGFCSGLHQYFVVKEPKKWADARRYCREKFIDLAVVNSTEETEQLVAAAGRSSFEGYAWIGLHDKFWGWKWVLTGEDVGTNVNGTFSTWGGNEPNNARIANESCAGIYQHTWHDVPCHRPLFFVCYNNSSTLEPNERYFYVEEKMTWHEARAYCQKHHTDLTSTKDQVEFDLVKRLIPFDRLVYIGMRRAVWDRWVDGIRRTFTNWMVGRPGSRTGNCASIVIDQLTPGKWREFTCSDKRPFVCQGQQEKHLYRTKLTVMESTADLNDPAVAEAILKHVEKKLKEKGISGVKLTWKKNKDGKIFHKEEEHATSVKTDL